MPYATPNNSNNIDRNANSANRQRRNWQRARQGALTNTIRTAAPITNNSTIGLAFFTSTGFGLVGNSLALLFADASIAGSSTGIKVKTLTGGGLATAAGGLGVSEVLNTADPITGGGQLSTGLTMRFLPSTDVNFNFVRIVNVNDPVSPQDAMTKNYFDLFQQGLQYKPTAQAATAAALPANTYAPQPGAPAIITANANGALAVDGYSPVVGDVVLVKNEATASHNGLYSVTQTGGVSAPFILTRHTNMFIETEFPGAFVPVAGLGAVNANTLWLANPTTPVTVGTTAIPFTELPARDDNLTVVDLTFASTGLHGVHMAGQLVFYENGGTLNLGCSTGVLMAAGPTLDTNLTFAEGTGQALALASANANDVVLSLFPGGGLNVDYTQWISSTGATVKAKVTKNADFVLPHLVGITAAPSIVSSTGAGTAPTLGISGTDLAGTITLTAGTLPAASAVIFTVTFTRAFAAAPIVVFTPANTGAAALSGTSMVYVTATSTGFSFNSDTAALVGTTQYIWNYHVIG